MVPMVLLLAGCGDLRVKMGIYANLDEARKAGALASGWVPEGLPAGASDLREGHLPDGRHWGAFSFPGARRCGTARAARIGDHHRHALVRAARPARVLAARAARAGRRRARALDRLQALQRPRRAHLCDQLGPGARLLLARLNLRTCYTPAASLNGAQRVSTYRVSLGVVVAALCLVTLRVPGLAQTAAPQSAQPTFRSTLDLLTLDTSVRDKGGQVVADLQALGFHRHHRRQAPQGRVRRVLQGGRSRRRSIERRRGADAAIRPQRPVAARPRRRLRAG